jgi:hypothetical protein
MKLILIISVLFICFFETKADEWPAPGVREYYNSDSSYFVRVIPATPLNSSSKYYNWVRSSANKKKQFSPEDTLAAPCRALMYKKTSEGTRLVWERNLINKIAPVSALISEKGDYLVTFDNWFSMGFGANVVVFYNRNGKLVQSYKLEDISPISLESYQRSMLSLQWQCASKFINSTQMEICFVDRNGIKTKKFFDLRGKK